MDVPGNDCHGLRRWCFPHSSDLWGILFASRYPASKNGLYSVIAIAFHQDFLLFWSFVGFNTLVAVLAPPKFGFFSNAVPFFFRQGEIFFRSLIFTLDTKSSIVILCFLGSQTYLEPFLPVSRFGRAWSYRLHGEVVDRAWLVFHNLCWTWNCPRHQGKARMPCLVGFFLSNQDRDGWVTRFLQLDQLNMVNHTKSWLTKKLVKFAKPWTSMPQKKHKKTGKQISIIASQELAQNCWTFVDKQKPGLTNHFFLWMSISSELSYWTHQGLGKKTFWFQPMVQHIGFKPIFLGFMTRELSQNFQKLQRIFLVPPSSNKFSTTGYLRS